MEIHRTDLKILWGSPLPPIRSGIADYAVELLPELAKLARVRVLSPPGWTPPENWPASIDVVPTDETADPDEVVLLHLGNNPLHLWLLDRLRSHRSVGVVLHDAVLHHLLVESTAAHGDLAAFSERIQTAHGPAGRKLADARAAGHHGRLDPFLLPARGAFLNDVDAVVVHSRWAEGLIRSEFPGKAVGMVGLVVADPAPTDRDEARRLLGLGPDELVLMHLGFLTPQKGLEEILAAIGAADRLGMPVKLVVVGEGSRADLLQRASARLGIEDRVLVTGWVEPERFPGLPAAADLGVVFRTPSAGETSAAALRFFSCGVPVAVGGIRQYLEWPETAAPRLTPGPAAPADLVRLLARIGCEGWAERGRAARAAYLESHLPAHAATAMVGFLNRLDFGA